MPKIKCLGSGKRPYVLWPDKRTGRFYDGSIGIGQVLHKCSFCGRLWRKNDDNNGWPNELTPPHFRYREESTKVFIVKQYDCCECETPCNCLGYTIDSVYFSWERARQRANELHRGFVDDYVVETL